MISTSSLIAMQDAELLARVTELAIAERHATAQLVAALAELDTRRLYLGQGCSSLFTYCTQVLHLSEHAAYGRIEAARAARRFPAILDRLADGSLTLTAVCLLAPHLTAENCADVLDAARHRTKREVKVLATALRPQPPVHPCGSQLQCGSGLQPRHRRSGLERGSELATISPNCWRRTITPSTRVLLSASPTAPSPAVAYRPAVVAPLTPEQYKLQITIDRKTLEKLQRVQDLLRHSIPDGDAAVIFDKAITTLLAELERTKLALTARPRQRPTLSLSSRHVSAAVRRAVWTRDGGRCAFVSENGRRCTERGFIEFHHTAPYAAGGDATVDSIELRCRAHNLYEGELDFGPAVRRHTTRNEHRALSDT
jgi:hypothetical protein